MNKGEQPAADAQQINLGLSEEQGAVRRDTGEKACGKMRGGSMELKGCDEEYWCGGGDYWNGKYHFGKCFVSKGRDKYSQNNPQTKKEQVVSDKGWALRPKLTSWRQHHCNKDNLFLMQQKEKIRYEYTQGYEDYIWHF